MRADQELPYGYHMMNDFGPSSLPIEVTEETLEEFLALERAIHSYEKRHLVETLQVRTDQLKTLNDSMDQMEDDYRDLNNKIAHGEWELQQSQSKNVKSYLMEQSNYDENASFEKAEHLAALNKREILRKELESSQHHMEELKQEVSALAEDVHDLQTLYQREEELLGALFGGEYGSPEENELEQALDSLEVHKQQVESANFKWKQAEVMVEFSVKQMGSAVDRWGNLTRLSMNHLEARYALAEETRNNLIAATQNLNGAQRYLPNINFPYCNREEVEMLTQATSYVFTDMQSPDRQVHALEVYNVTFRRCAALLQWFDVVINNVIAKDLLSVSRTAKEKSSALRRERIRLIRDRLRENGRDVELDNDFNIDSDSEEADLFLNQMPDLKQRESMRDSVDFRLPSPLPQVELAPPPTKEELFGKIEELKAEHNDTVDSHRYGSNVNRARVEQDLQAKLKERRMRRARQQIGPGEEVMEAMQRRQSVVNGGMPPPHHMNMRMP